jgi:hypothetical protein
MHFSALRFSAVFPSGFYLQFFYPDALTLPDMLKDDEFFIFYFFLMLYCLLLCNAAKVVTFCLLEVHNKGGIATNNFRLLLGFFRG